MNIKYKNEVIILRDVSYEDAYEMMRISQDEEVMKFYGWPPFKSLQEAKK